MPNLILTKICNLECPYCFAGNKKQTKIIDSKIEITTTLFLYYLKHLKYNNENTVRLLGGEPLLHSLIRDYIKISLKGGFKVLIFSNLALSSSYIKKIFDNLPDVFYSKITVNINLNPNDFYKNNELNFLKENARFLKNKGINIIISTMLDYNIDFDYITNIADEIGTKNIKFKPLNGKNYGLITSSYEYGDFTYSIIQKYSNKYNLSFSCGLSKFIFSDKQLNSIKNDYSINIKFGCSANGGKYDIDINGDIFRCFPLQKLYIGKNINLKTHYKFSISENIKNLELIYNTGENKSNCLSNKI